MVRFFQDQPKELSLVKLPFSQSTAEPHFNPTSNGLTDELSFSVLTVAERRN